MSHMEPDRIGISDARLEHSLEVARRAQDIGAKLGLTSDASQEELFVLGFLHDIGYEFCPRQEEHEHVGGTLLKRLGFAFADEVYNHGDPSSEYRSLYLDILNAADMLTGPHGEHFTYEERLGDIANRYGSSSEQYSKAQALFRILQNRGFDSIDQ